MRGPSAAGGLSPVLLADRQGYLELHGELASHVSESWTWERRTSPLGYPGRALRPRGRMGSHGGV